MQFTPLQTDTWITSRGFGPQCGQNSACVVAWGYLGPHVSNNVAEYIGVLAAVRHAAAHGYEQICVQVDSLLVAQQVNYKWACRSPELRPLLEQVWQYLRQLPAHGESAIVEHIYREFNTEADALANRAVSDESSCPWHLQGEN